MLNNGIAWIVRRGCARRNPALAALIAAELVFLCIYGAMRLYPHLYVKAFDFDGERNVTAIFSAVQLVWTAGAIASFMLVPGMVPPQLRRLAWAACAGFLFLGLDEYMEWHERINLAVPGVRWLPLLKNGHGGWISVYLSIAAILALLFLRPAMEAARLYPRPAAIFLAGLLTAFSGSAGFEIVAFQFLELGMNDPAYPFAVAAEEFLEMTGGSIMLYAVLAFGAEAFPASAAGGKP